MAVIQSGSTSIDTWRKQHRVAPFFNTTNETVPPYAIMQRWRPKEFKEDKSAKNTEEENRFNTQHVRAGRFAWDITQCSEAAESRQDPNEFVFNGPVAVGPQRYGECTEDFPCQVLHNGDHDQLVKFAPCGPVANTWYVQSGRSAFSCISHDLLEAAGGGLVHTVWVKPSNGRNVSAMGKFIVGGNDIHSSEYFDFSGVADGEPLKNITVNDDANDEDGIGWLKVQRSGLYSIGFQAKLSSSDAPRAAGLLITLYRRSIPANSKTPGDPKTTYYVAARDQDIEQDEGYLSPYRTAENVAFSGWLNLKSGELLRLRNSSDHKLSVAAALFSIASFGAYYDTTGAEGQSLDSSS